jgi:hypothetical protein
MDIKEKIARTLCIYDGYVPDDPVLCNHSEKRWEENGKYYKYEWDNYAIIAEKILESVYELNNLKNFRSLLLLENENINLRKTIKQLECEIENLSK